jgi:hypothetical protein
MKKRLLVMKDILFFYTEQSIHYGDAISSVASSNSKSFSTDSMLTRKS